MVSSEFNEGFKISQHERLLFVEYTQLMSLLNKNHLAFDGRDEANCCAEPEASPPRKKVEPGRTFIPGRSRPKLHQSAGNGCLQCIRYDVGKVGQSSWRRGWRTFEAIAATECPVRGA